MRYGRALRVDQNQAGIVKDLERIGASVFDTSSVGGGFPDLIVGFRGQTHLVEVKNPKTAHGKAGLSDSQKDFAAIWQGGPIYMVRTGIEAITLILDLDRRTDPAKLDLVKL